MNNTLLASQPLGFPWVTADPFLFCVHHLDLYPEGDERMAPAASLAGRRIGMDFEIRDGWRMYHGDVVPGFPRHPHRGFETISLARQGYIDHSDSLGATARFGLGDVQWMTAGAGIVHSEMFPLLDREGPNTLEMFQIWLNLPAANKLVEPHFAMFWAEDIPQIDHDGVKVTLIAGAHPDHPTPPKPPPNSWAARDDADVAVWTLQMEPGATWQLPPAREGTRRTLYFFAGKAMTAGGEPLERDHASVVRSDRAIELANGDLPAEVLLLQGRPIGEPVAQHGPFVMNTPGEIRQAFADYQGTQFGGWPWPDDAPVHDRDKRRFAIHADGRRSAPAGEG